VADTLLVKFAWIGDDSIQPLRAALGRRELSAFRAIDGEEAYAYVPLPPDPQEAHSLTRVVRSALREGKLSRLELLMDLRGASAGQDAPYHYVVETDVRAEHEADLNAWYDEEHLAGLASVPGTVRAMRFRSLHGSPRYHACYDLTRAETLGSAPWLAVRGTPWSDRVRPSFFNTKRTMFRRV